MRCRLMSSGLVSRALAPSWGLLLAVSTLTPLSDSFGQQSQVASRGPRFLLAASLPGREVDATSAPVLHRRVSLELTDATVGDALKELTRQADLEISYTPRVVPLDRPLSLHVRGITIAAALTEILLDIAVDVSVTARGGLALVPRPPAIKPESGDTGSVTGQVTDSSNGSPIVGATVSIEGTGQAATTDASGRFHIVGLAPGTYKVQARYIGYMPMRQDVVLVAGGEATVNFALSKSAQELNQLVVTGTIVPTEVRTLPTPVSVITSDDLDRRQAYELGEVIRQTIPTAVSRRNNIGSPTTTFFSVRGAASLFAVGGQMKVFVDGVEVADRTNPGVPLNNIERVEILRGPQAAAIYGSDAIAGVIQIFTKHGENARPRVTGEGSWGLIQTPYANYGEAFRHTYSASVDGGGPTGSYRFAANYEHTDEYVREGTLENGGVSGGARIVRGILSLDISGRYFVNRSPAVVSPALAETGFPTFSKPYHWPYQHGYQAFGVHAHLAPAPWWQHSLTIGFDRHTMDMASPEARRVFPDDTLLSVYSSSQMKAWISYNTSAQGRLGNDLSGLLTVGVDYNHFPLREFFSFQGLLKTDPTLVPAPGRVISANRNLVTNAGYFTQAQLGFRDALYLTAGIRAEENSEFGDSHGTPVSPRIGLSYAPRLGRDVTLRLRAAWGRAIRAPTVGLKLGTESGTAIRLPNPLLAPERQQGWDGGIDVFFGPRASLGLTYYDQRAENLIDFVTVATSPMLTTQAQNVGRVSNRGLEAEASLSLGPGRITAQYGYTRARVDQLAPGYTGNQSLGEQVLSVPKHTAGAYGTVDIVHGTALTAGLAYVGGWRWYNNIAFYGCLAGTGPCRASTPSIRDYITRYPGFLKLNATISQRITGSLAGFLRVENLTDNRAFEFGDDATVMGRISTVGLRLER